MRTNGVRYVLSLVITSVFVLHICLPRPTQSGDVLFKDVGLAAAQTSYGHITFALHEEDLHIKFAHRAREVFAHFISASGLSDFPVNGHNCGKHGVKCTPHVLRSEKLSYVHVLVAELQDLVVTTEQVTREMGTMTFGHHYQFSNRDRRQFFELAFGVTEILNLGLTIHNSMELAEFKRKMATLESRVQGLITLSDEIMRTELRDHHMIMKITNQTIELNKTMMADRITTMYVGYKMILLDIKEEALATYAALALLHQGIISPVLVNYTCLNNAFKEFKLMAARQGLAPLFPTADTLLAAHATYWIENRSTLRIALPVAVANVNSKFLSAYRLENEPTTIPGPEGLQAVFISPHRYILINEDRSFYFALTEDDWSRCTLLAGKRICTEVRMRRDSFSSSCISALFAGLPERKQKCDIRVRKAPVFEVKEVKAGLLRVLSSSDIGVQWRTRCFGSPDKIGTTRNGTSYIEVPEGCTVYGPDGAYTRPPNTVEVATNITLIDQHDLSLPASLANFANWSEVRTFLDEASITEYVEATKLSEMRESRISKDLHSVPLVVDEVSIADVVLLTIIAAIVVLGIVAGCCYFKRRSQAGKRTHEELAMSNIDSPTSAPRLSVVETKMEAAPVEQVRSRPQKKPKAGAKSDIIVIHE